MRKISNSVKTLLVLAAVMISGFQNCSGKGILSASFFSEKSSPGNGSGYEGVTPVGPDTDTDNGNTPEEMFLLYLTDGQCSGGLQGPSQIRFSQGAYIIERWDCEPISPPRQVPANQITIDTTNPLVLYYEGRTFRQR